MKRSRFTEEQVIAILREHEASVQRWRPDDGIGAPAFQDVGAAGRVPEPRLAAYIARGEDRPAYQRAFAAQLATNALTG